MTTERVETLERLRQLIDEKRAVVVPSSYSFGKPRPAAFMLNMAGSVLLGLFRRGMYVYEKPKAEEHAA